jgi:hypothetical protein
MVTGSVAALFYGRDRTTVDVDIVIEMRGVNAEGMAAAFEPDWFLDADMVRDSIATSFMFNAIPVTGGPKIDFIPLKSDPFERNAFQRRRTLDWHGTPLSVIAGVDLALSKLRWAKDSMSERQLADVRAIMSFGVVDDDEYFQHWIRVLGLQHVVDASRETRYDA